MPEVDKAIHPRPPQTPRMRLANCMSFCMMVTRLACRAQRFVSSNKWTRKASAASWRAWIACDCQRISSPRGRMVMAISRTRRAKGSLRSRRSVLFWYLLISRSAWVPGRYRRFGLCGRGSPGCTSLGRDRLLAEPCAIDLRAPLPWPPPPPLPLPLPPCTLR